MATVMASKAGHHIRPRHCLEALEHKTLSYVYVEIHRTKKKATYKTLTSQTRTLRISKVFPFA